ncbi:MAG TPA: hypothetical protein EYH07_06885, partial [Kiloniellaceae bacterium]|nr:hypothetical protein [Kiloniellaceae bacterium]
MAQLEQSYDKAISEDTRGLCEDALAANPDDTAVMTAVARAYLRIGPLSRVRELFLAAAERGNLDAMAGLGFICMAGLGLDDYAQAFRWLRKPAAAGNADAQNMLG